MRPFLQERSTTVEKRSAKERPRTPIRSDREAQKDPYRRGIRCRAVEKFLSGQNRLIVACV